jgi:hypothetical protein
MRGTSDRSAIDDFAMGEAYGGCDFTVSVLLLAIADCKYSVPLDECTLTVERHGGRTDIVACGSVGPVRPGDQRGAK